MGIVKGLKDLNKALDKPQHSGGEGSKARWVKLEDGESVKIRFLQELDPDSPNYIEKNGLGFIAVDTSYTIIPLAKDEAQFDSSSLELYKLEETAVRDLPYAEQDAFFAGEGGHADSSSATSSSLDWV